MSLKEYKSGTAHSGVIGRTFDTSEPAWPELNRAKEGAPNVLFIVLDDTGYGQLGCYGSPINTPNIDKLAQNGLLYSNMHTTALCSPTRSCVLTGRNHHSNHVAAIMELSAGYPGYDCYIPFENGFLSETLLQQGYNTYAVGKWHLTPAEQMSAAGPYERWPQGRGFERYYGFLGGDTHQFYPNLVYDSHQVEPEKTPEEGYHLTEDLADKAIGFIGDAKQVAPDKPFFMYFATGATHAPHHAPKEWIDKYKGQFDDGWEAYREKVFAKQKKLAIVPQDAELSRHDPDVQKWDDLPEDEKKLYARMMEVYAGFLAHTDHQIGRLIDFLEDLGELDNTLIMIISDNGASPEGGPTGSVNENKIFNNVPESLEENLAAMDELGGPKYFNHYAWGWTWAGDTPFRRWKRETYRGGISDPFIVHWPAGIKAKGKVRTQYAHAIDMVPTVLDALGLEPPTEIKGVTQSTMEGISFATSFDDGGAENKHTTQYFEMFGHRSLYHEGWRAICPYPGPSFVEGEELGYHFPGSIKIDQLKERDRDGWELYHVSEDFAENHNVADQNPDVLQEMIAMWYVEAGKYNVLPVEGPDPTRFAADRPTIAQDQDRFIYYPGTQAVPENAAAKVLNRSHVISAVVDIPKAGAEGVLLSHGGSSGGYTLFVMDGKLHYVHNYVGIEEFHLISDEDVPQGRAVLSYEFEVAGPPDIPNGKGTAGVGKLYINEKQVGQMELPYTMPITISIDEGLSCGEDPGSPTTPLYQPPFAFTGTLHRVAVDVSGERIEDHEAEIRLALARQ